MEHYPFTILIIDDSKAYSLRLKRLLTCVANKLGLVLLDIVTIHNPSTARMLDQYFDICFVDEVFRGSSLSGTSLVRKLREYNSDTCTVLISGRKLIRKVQMPIDVSVHVKLAKCDLTVPVLRQVIEEKIRQQKYIVL